MIKKQRVVVVCPGRGTYNKEELGYLLRHHQDKQNFIATVDEYRKAQGQETVSNLDGSDKYQMRKHTAGEHASALIYACAMCDYKAIDLDKYEVVAVTGNSMGWYIAMAAAGALPEPDAIKLINTMGSMMAGGIIGGQIIYPIVDEQWHIDNEKRKQVLSIMASVNEDKQNQVYVSIYLGGFIVFAGNDAGLKAMTEQLPMIDERYPMHLFNHGAFHSPLLNDISTKGLEALPSSMFKKPDVPLIDGNGKIWQPYSTDIEQLRNYTLTTQVVEPYNFSAAIEVAIKEFAPDKLVILGPGATLGSSVAHTLIANQWLGQQSKQDFVDRQKQDPFVLAMGLDEQRQLVI